MNHIYQNLFVWNYRIIFVLLVLFYIFINLLYVETFVQHTL